jgi:Leucine-rich repeat (LRR) protein
MVERRRYCPCTSDGFLLLVPIFALFLLCDASVAAAAADAPSSPPLDEKQALIMKSLSSIVGINGWGTAPNPCNWRGATCSSSASGSSLVVTNITLRGLGISNSTVFAYLCRLETLAFLDLSKNLIPSPPNGSLPTPCAMSAGMRHLNLSSNGLSGPLANFSVFPKLEVLDLSLNKFSGHVSTDLISLPKLRSLNLSTNNLGGDVPLPASMPLDLQELVLSGNSFIGHIPKDLFRYSNLTMLDLSQNSLNGEVDSDFRKLHKLKTLLLSGNNLSGPIPESLSTLENLSRFAANQNNFTGSIPNGISKHLKMLDLSYNNLSGPIPSDLLSPSGLVSVDLTKNQLDGNITGKISGSLYRLRLGSNKLTGGIPDAVGDALGLTYLELDNNTFGGKIPEQLGNCKKLTLLNLAHNKLEGSVPGGFGNLKKLEVLQLQMNNLSGSIPIVFYNLSNLGILNLSQNSFTGEMAPNLFNLANLTNVNLQGNKITGEIPSTISSLTSLIELNITSNELTGPIPLMPTSLKTALNLSHNHLDGPIPQNIGSLADLEILDLSYNNLSGQVPSSLVGLQSLTVLVISYNQLSGRLPRFGPYVSVISNGNPDLMNVTQYNMDASTSSRRHTALIIIFALAGTLIGLIVLAAVAVYSYSKRIYRVEDVGVLDENIPQIISSHLITMNSIHTSAIEFMKATEAVTNHNNIFLKTRFCTYYKAVMPNGSTYSVKKLNWSDKIFQIGCKERFGHEIEVLGKLTNSNVMVPLAYILTVDCAYLIYEHAYKGTVSDFLHGGSSDVLDWPSRYSIALGVAQGLTFLHGCTQPVLLLDLSTRTIHLKSTNESKIGDVELYKIIDPSRSTGSFSTIAGTVGYIPPGKMHCCDSFSCS